MKKYFLLLLITCSITFINPPKLFAQTNLCTELEGLKLYSNEVNPQYLGTFSSDRYDSDSISYKYGDYGDKYGTNSIFNRYGDYGSKYGSYSPWNKYTSTPPYIVDGEYNIVGVLTINSYTSDAVNTMQALSCIVDLSDDRLTPYLEDNPIDSTDSDALSTPVITAPATANKFPDAITETKNTIDEIQLTWNFPNATSYSVFIHQNDETGDHIVLRKIDINDTTLALEKILLDYWGKGKIEVGAYDSEGDYIGTSYYFYDYTEGDISSSQNQSSFNDISSSNYKNAIIYLKQQGIINGYSDGSFKPDIAINRAEFTKVVVGTIEPNPIGSSCFSDINNEWFAPYICYAKNSKIIDGYKDGTFKPNQNINLAEALKIVLLALKVSLSTNTGASWYDVYVNTANEKNLLNAINPELTHEVTRGEMAQLIYNIKNNQ